ncbi:hypothetical protein Fot_19971 [Forsythia ovata]|uniref:Uncharacterized protein n=1 Tax=Forsythia ovata TaxID=205694 RepID=A0ABD1VQD5_9LAMI
MDIAILVRSSLAQGGLRYVGEPHKEFVLRKAFVDRDNGNGIILEQESIEISIEDLVTESKLEPEQKVPHDLIIEGINAEKSEEKKNTATSSTPNLVSQVVNYKDECNWATKLRPRYKHHKCGFLD